MRESDEQRGKRKRTLIGIFIAAVMILSTFGFVMEYSTQSGGNVERVNGIKFEVSGQNVVATINRHVVDFHFFPSQANLIDADADAMNLLRTAKTFYITSDAKDTYAQDIDEATFFMTTTLPQIKSVYPVPAFTNSTGYERPQVTCANATAAFPVVNIHRGNTTAIRLQGSCVDVSAYAPQDIYREADRIVMAIAGVTDGVSN